MAEAEWSFPRPEGLRFADVTEGGYRLSWDAVTGPKGEHPSGYTVETFQLDGVKVDEFTVRGTSASEYGRGGHGLHPGWTYRTLVWANGGPKGPPHAEIRVTLRPHIERAPAPVRPVPPAPPRPTQPPGPPSSSVPTTAPARGSSGSVGPHPALWQPWAPVLAHAEDRLRVEITQALRAYDHAVGEASTLLDVAYSEAAEVAGQLEDTAFRAWSRGMQTAAEASARILGPALKAYTEAIGQAHTDFDRALGSAETAYKQVVTDTGRAKTDAPPAASAA